MPTLPARVVIRRTQGAAVTILVAVSLSFLACAAGTDPGPGTAAPTATAPVARDVAIDGVAWRVLVAGDEGMRGRTDFGDADGMLFDMGGEVQPSAVAFVMDGVLVPLDIAWFAADGRLVGTARMTPCAAEPCLRHVAPAPFRWAIEAPVGAFARTAADARLVVDE
jgi:uncharacterized membrane protein (UPF0127 family)